MGSLEVTSLFTESMTTIAVRTNDELEKRLSGMNINRQLVTNSARSVAAKAAAILANAAVAEGAAKRRTDAVEKAKDSDTMQMADNVVDVGGESAALAAAEEQQQERDQQSKLDAESAAQEIEADKRARKAAGAMDIDDDGTYEANGDEEATEEDAGLQDGEEEEEKGDESAADDETDVAKSRLLLGADENDDDMITLAGDLIVRDPKEIETANKQAARDHNMSEVDMNAELEHAAKKQRQAAAELKKKLDDENSAVDRAAVKKAQVAYYKDNEIETSSDVIDEALRGYVGVVAADTLRELLPSRREGPKSLYTRLRVAMARGDKLSPDEDLLYSTTDKIGGCVTFIESMIGSAFQFAREGDSAVVSTMFRTILLDVTDMEIVKETITIADATRIVQCSLLNMPIMMSSSKLLRCTGKTADKTPIERQWRVTKELAELCIAFYTLDNFSLVVDKLVKQRFLVLAKSPAVKNKLPDILHVVKMLLEEKIKEPVLVLAYRQFRKAITAVLHSVQRFDTARTTAASDARAAEDAVTLKAAARLTNLANDQDDNNNTSTMKQDTNGGGDDDADESDDEFGF